MVHLKTAVRKSIATRLTAWESVIILVAFIIIAVSSSCINYRFSTAKEQQTMQAYLNNALSSVDNKLKDMGRVSLTTFSDSETQRILKTSGARSYAEEQSDDAYLQTLYLNLITIRNDIRSIYLFDNQSLVFHLDANNASIKKGGEISSFILWMEGLEESPRNDVAGCKLALKQQPDFTRNVSTESPYGNYCLYMVREIKSFSPNARIGHILIVSPVSVMKTVLEEFLDQGSSFFLIDADGAIICSGDGASVGKNLREVNPGVLAQIKGERGTFQADLYQEKQMVSYKKSAYSGLTLIMAKPMRDVYQSTRLLVQTTCAVLLGLLALVVVITGKATQKEVDPISRLSETMAHVKKGNTRVSLPVTTEDEVGQLTESFNSMLETINDMIFSEYESQIAVQTAQLKQKETELLYLRNQINPHFLYNTLDTIRMKAAINGDPDVSSMIMLLVDFFRYSLVGNTQVVPIEHEVKLIQTYLNLMRYRYPDLEDAYDVDETLNQLMMPNFVLQPLVENCLLHGLKAVHYKGKIEISIHRDKFHPDEILITISDNGIGLSASKKSELEYALQHPRKAAKQFDPRGEKNHIGIVNVQQRLRMYYSDDCGIRYEDHAGGGTTAVVRIKDRMSAAVLQNMESDGRSGPEAP